MYNYRKSLNKTIDPSKPKSKRWITATGSALEETAEAIKKIDRSVLVNEMNKRKIANTKSSLNFGSEKIDYISDARDNQNNGLKIDVEERISQFEKNQQMKKELTMTTFALGDDTKPEYFSANRLAMAEADNFKNYPSARQETSAVREMVKSSTLSFAHSDEPVKYATVMRDAMNYRGNEMNFNKIKKEIQTMKKALVKHNFSFGEGSTEYKSDYQRGYGSIDESHYRAAGQHREAMHAIKADLRATHWSFGDEKVRYISDMHEALTIHVDPNHTKEVFDNIERAREMKMALQKTSLKIGEDEEYY